MHASFPFFSDLCTLINDERKIINSLLPIRRRFPEFESSKNSVVHGKRKKSSAEKLKVCENESDDWRKPKMSVFHFIYEISVMSCMFSI